MNTRAIFQSKKQLRNWWARIVDDPNYAEVLLHARSMFVEAGPTDQHLRGANTFEQILSAMAEGDPTSDEMPSPGILHHIEQAPPRPDEPATPAKSKRKGTNVK